MKYTMLGDDASSAEEKLEKYLGEVAWSYLKPHYERDALYFVDPELPLQEVGAAFAENRVSDVEAWLKSGDLVKIGKLHAAQWEGGNDQFEALVVFAIRVVPTGVTEENESAACPDGDDG